MELKNVIGISIIIPCYNEMVQLPKTIDLLTKFLSENFIDYELIIVNDGSIDKTDSLMKTIFSLDKINKQTLNYLSYTINKGKGFAVRLGLSQAKHDLKVILDCDLSIEPHNIIKTIKYNGFNFSNKRPFAVIGQRIQRIEQPKYRIFLGNCFRKLVNLFIGINFNDTQAPFKVLFSIKNEYLQELSIDGFAYDVELIKMLKEKNIFIQLEKVDYYNDKNSKVTILKTIRMGLDLIKISFMNFKN